MSCVATVELCDARWMTQVTVGMLLLKSAKFASFRLHTTSSMMSRSSNSPAISRSEFVIIPLRFDADLTLDVVSMYVDTLSNIGPHSSPHPSITMCS